MSPHLKTCLPSLPLPRPLRGADIGSFAHDTIIRRLPNIVRQTLLDNNFPAVTIRRLQDLLSEIPEGRIRPLDDPGAPDSDSWENWIAPHLHQTWLEAPWFFVETYFYRRILAATSYFNQPAEQRSDPFAHQKQAGLAAALPSARTLASRLPAWLDEPDAAALFERLFHMVLWGNQADLSVWPVGRESQLPKGRNGPNLVLDESRRTAHSLTGSHLPTAQVDFIIDNAGFELVCDLLAADVLLQRGMTQKVIFHLKPHPTFVSDAMPADTIQTMDTLAADSDPQTRALGSRLKDLVESGMLELTCNFFWTSPLSLWKMPADLRLSFASSALVVSKGDANFRRWLGDLRWDETLPFHRIVDYFSAPLMVLRVLKSDLLVGMQPELIAQLDNNDPTWRINGQTGMIVTNLPE